MFENMLNPLFSQVLVTIKFLMAIKQHFQLQIQFKIKQAILFFKSE